MEASSVTVTTVYVGASAELVRGFITTPLERAIAAADGIDYMQSKSAPGPLDDHRQAGAQLRFHQGPLGNKLQATSGAPGPAAGGRGAGHQRRIRRKSVCRRPISASSPTFLSRIRSPIISSASCSRDLSAVEGVQRADILGARTFAMRIWLKPERMAALNVSPSQVRQALAANNYLAAVGQTKGSLVQVNLTANTDLRSVEEFKRLVIREQDGAIVRLEDIGEVALGAEDYDTEVRLSGQTAVFMGIFAAAQRQHH